AMFVPGAATQGPANGGLAAAVRSTTSAATAESVLAPRASPAPSIAGSKISETMAAALVIKPLRSIVATNHLVGPLIIAHRVRCVRLRYAYSQRTNATCSQTRRDGFPARLDCLSSEARDRPSLPPSVDRHARFG